jgi:integrase/recombinase XerD
VKAYLEVEDVESMERVAGCLRDRLLIRLLFRLGCRVSEALAIRIGDVDFARATVTILHLKRRIRLLCPNCTASLGKRHRFCPECGEQVAEAGQRQQEHRRVRTLPVDKRTLEILEDYFSQNQLVRSGSAFVFGVNRHRAWQIVRDCARRAGLPDLVNPDTGKARGVSPHRLRDAFSVHAMKLDDSGDALRLLQEHLGHESFNTTAKYRKVAGEEHRRWYERLWSENDAGE